MDFKDMTYIIAIAKYQNITKAAESLYVTQPTITKFVQNLEHRLGQKLFKKLGNRFTLTYAGERYIEKAAEIVDLKKKLDQEMADILKLNIGVLKVAFPIMRGTYMLPCTLPIFNSLYPHVKLNIIEENSGTLESLILNGDTDLAFFNLPVRSPDIDYEIISHEEIVLTVSPNHPMAGCGVQREGCKYPWIDLKKFADDRFILQLPEQRTRQIVDKVLKNAHIQPGTIFTTRNITASATLAATGYGVCFTCETHLNHIQFETEPVRFSVGEPSTTVDFVAAFRKGAYLPYHAKEYIKIVKEFT